MAHFLKDTVFSKRMSSEKLMILPASFNLSLYLLYSFYVKVIQVSKNINIGSFKMTWKEDGLPI